MAVVCPTNYVDQFSKHSRMRSCTRRRKDYQIPLHVDCSVEYELPNSAKPPMGNKNEPLLMIHPSYYRREESKRRSQFVNNLPVPKRRTSCRSTRNTVYRGVENTINYGTNNCMLTRQRMNNCNDRKNVADNAQTSTKIPVSAIFPTPPNFDNACLQSRTASHCNKNMQSSVPLTSACTAPKVHQVGVNSLWRRAIETNSVPQPSIDFNEMSGMSQMHISEHAPVPGPVLDSASTHRIDFWGLNFPNVVGSNEKYDNNDDGKYYNRARDRSKKTFCDNNESVSAHSLKSKSVKRNTIYCENTVGGSVVNPASVVASTGAVTLQHQQPAVGVAAIAATPLNCNNCSSVISTVEGNRHPLIRQQPWSATTAPDFAPPALPMSHVIPNRPLIGIVYPDVQPQLPPTRKRTSDSVSWRCDEFGSDDATLAKRNRISVNGNAQINNHRSWTNNDSEACKMYYPQESHEMYNNYSNSCAIAGNAVGATCNAWNRSGENLNALHLFRL